MEPTKISKKFVSEWPLYLSFAGVFIWLFSSIILLSGNAAFANDLAFYGYWLLFIGLFCLMVNHIRELM